MPFEILYIQDILSFPMEHEKGLLYFSFLSQLYSGLVYYISATEEKWRDIISLLHTRVWITEQISILKCCSWASPQSLLFSFPFPFVFIRQHYPWHVHRYVRYLNVWKCVFLTHVYYKYLMITYFFNRKKLYRHMVTHAS